MNSQLKRPDNALSYSIVQGRVMLLPGTTILSFGLCLKTSFWKVFPKKKNFLDSFYQALLSKEVVLSDSYASFFIKIETDVWQNLQIPTYKKEDVIL